MAGRPKKNMSIKDEIAKQEEAVAKSKAKYDEDVKKLKNLYAKQDEIKKKVYKNSKREYKVIDGVTTRIKEYDEA